MKSEKQEISLLFQFLLRHTHFTLRQPCDVIIYVMYRYINAVKYDK